jgi:hypothetical protein
VNRLNSVRAGLTPNIVALDAAALAALPGPGFLEVERLARELGVGPSGVTRTMAQAEPSAKYES